MDSFFFDNVLRKVFDLKSQELRTGNPRVIQ